MDTRQGGDPGRDPRNGDQQRDDHDPRTGGRPRDDDQRPAGRDDQRHAGRPRGDGARRRADLPAADREALRRLVDDGVLSPAQAEAVTGALVDSRRARPRGRWLAEVAGYAGGGLVLAGLAALYATSWGRFTDAEWFATLLIIALILAGAAFVAARGGDGLRRLRRHGPSARRRVVGVLFGVSSWAVAGAAAAGAVDRYAATAGFAAGLVVALAGYVVLPTAFGLVVSAGFSTLLVLAGTAELALDPVAGALLLSGTGVAWAGLAVAGRVTPRPSGLGVGAVIAVGGAQWLVAAADATAWGYLLTGVLAAGCLALYRSLPHPVLLVVGVVATGTVATELAWEVTGGSPATAAILLVAGLALVAVSISGLRRRRRA
ncbi:MAG TPA: hypothetical protein VKY81_05225 [Natronosporangium sp.]|nr:hypothetical protein [Natronosporangium sp.]